MACFARHFGRSPEALGPEEIRRYQLYVIQEKKASWSTFNQAVCALRFLYRITLPRDWAVTMIAYAKMPKKLPCVLAGPRKSRNCSDVRNLPSHVWCWPRCTRRVCGWTKPCT